MELFNINLDYDLGSLYNSKLELNYLNNNISI